MKSQRYFKAVFEIRIIFGSRTPSSDCQLESWMCRGSQREAQTLPGSLGRAGQAAESFWQPPG